MENPVFSKPNLFLKMRTMRMVVIATILIGTTQFNQLLAQQPTLSIQGILKKASGEAVPDGNYNLVFRLYNAPTGGTMLWDEIQSDVEVISGIYSTVLGNTDPLNVPFDQTYYLGVTVGSTEMTPRIQLTSAPYALALIGSTNQFPSSGLVRADSMKVNGGVLADGGAPGLNGVNRNGYAFSGSNGDKDSGMFSTSDGQVSLYVNNIEVLVATPSRVVVNNLELGSQGKIKYGTRDDWRLVYDDNLASGPSEWKVYNAISGEHIGWNNPTDDGLAPVANPGNTHFAGHYLRPTDNNNQVLKKYFDLSGVGPHTQVKVKFKYYFLDTWDSWDNDIAWAAFANNASGQNLHMGWINAGYTWYDRSTDLTTTAMNAQNSWGGYAPLTDYATNGEMTGYVDGNGFWLFFGASLDSEITNEGYGVGNIEIWVK
jgi:hypothetical protein